MKKILFGFGTVAAVVAPVVAVVACDDNKEETKINGKTAAEIKKLTVAEFNTFLNDTLHKAQPETLDANKADYNIKFELSTDKKTLTYTDTLGGKSVLNTTDATKPEFLAALGIYKSVQVGKPATDAQSKAGGEVKAWWKDVVDATKAYFTK